MQNPSVIHTPICFLLIFKYFYGKVGGYQVFYSIEILKSH